MRADDDDDEDDDDDDVKGCRELFVVRQDVCVWRGARGPPPRGREVMYVTLKVQKSDIKFANGSSTF